MMARGAPNLAKRDLRNLQTTRASLVGSAFALTHFDRVLKSGKMIGGQIFCSFFVSDDNIEFLEQKDPPHQSWLSIFLSEEILYSRMVGLWESGNNPKSHRGNNRSVTREVFGTSSAIPIGSEIDRSANSSVMQVGVSSGRERFFQTEYGIRLMLAPRSAKALHVLIPENSQGIRKWPGVLPKFLCFFTTSFSIFLLKGNGIDAFWLGLEALTGAFTGSEIEFIMTRDNRSWDSSLLPFIIEASVLCDLGGVVTVLAGKVPEVEATHLVSEELELDRRELDKQEVEQPEVDRFDLD
ncbi:hypothetical protein Tco_0058809 [Tanacetum coccineum]